MKHCFPLHKPCYKENQDLMEHPDQLVAVKVDKLKDSDVMQAVDSIGGFNYFLNATGEEDAEPTPFRTCRNGKKQGESSSCCRLGVACHHGRP